MVTLTMPQGRPLSRTSSRVSMAGWYTGSVRKALRAPEYEAAIRKL